MPYGREPENGGRGAEDQERRFLRSVEPAEEHRRSDDSRDGFQARDPLGIFEWMPIKEVAGGAYVATFFVGMYAPIARLRPPPPSHGTLSMASSEASRRK